ncbi:MAG: GxxExxY protein [Saprospirales bacterium]|nr:GxxExxY protein [Saprospirales bacterium]
MERSNYLHSEITGLVLKAFFKVYNQLGYGFLEKVYENAMMIELRKMGLKCTQQTSIQVYYETEKVGSYLADIIVKDCVILELKAAENIAPEHEAQLVNYLRATDLEVGLLLNFGKSPNIPEKYFTNKFKKS